MGLSGVSPRGLPGGLSKGSLGVSPRGLSGGPNTRRPCCPIEIMLLRGIVLFNIIAVYHLYKLTPEDIVSFVLC